MINIAKLVIGIALVKSTKLEGGKSMIVISGVKIDEFTLDTLDREAEKQRRPRCGQVAVILEQWAREQRREGANNE